MKPALLLTLICGLAGSGHAQTGPNWTVIGTADMVALRACDAAGQCFGLACTATDDGNPRLTVDLATTGILPPSQSTLRIEVDGQAFDATLYGDMATDSGPIQPYLSDLMPLKPNPFLDLLASGNSLRIAPDGSFSGMTLPLDGMRYGFAAFVPACADFAATPLPTAPVDTSVDDAAYRTLFDELSVEIDAFCAGGKISEEAFVPQPDGTMEVDTGFMDCNQPTMASPYCGATGYCAVRTYELQSGRYVLVREELRRG